MKKIYSLIILLVFGVFTLTSCLTTQAQLKLAEAINYSKQGNEAMYVKLVKEAHDLDPEDPFIINDIARVYWDENNLAEAEAHYKECIQKAGDLKIGKSDMAQYEGKPLKMLCEDNLKKFQDWKAKQGKK
jgi:tetratricopeptide (TPR) repeat protein